MDLRAHPRGKRESKPGADESQEQLPLRGSARGARARPAGGRLRADQAGYASARNPGWTRRRGPAPRVTWPRLRDTGRPTPGLCANQNEPREGAGPWGRMLTGAPGVAGRNQRDRATLGPGGGPDVGEIRRVAVSGFCPLSSRLLKGHWSQE